MRILIFISLLGLFALSCNRPPQKANTESNTPEMKEEKITDADGNEYSTVKIGDQVWLVEYLQTTKYRDGSSITYVEEANDWATYKGGAFADIPNKDKKNPQDLGQV